MDFLALKTRLNEFFPVIAVGGEDAYLRAKASEIIFESLNILLPQINVNAFDAESDIDGLLNACRTVPLGSEKRMVKADFSLLPKVVFSPKDREKLTKYFASPNIGTCLVFLVQNLSDLPDDGVAKVNCRKLPQDSLIRWIIAVLKNSGKAISVDAARLVAEYCLRDMTRISRETEKLAACAEAEITAGTVKALVTRDLEFQVFDLSNHIAAKKSDRALSVLAAMLKNGEEPLGVLALLYNFYRRMYYASVSQGLSDAEKAAKLGVKEYAITKMKPVMLRYNQVKLKNALEIFESAESKIKKTWVKDENMLNLVVLKLLNL